MAGMIESKLTELGLTLPALAAPIANYVGFVRTGDLLFVSGQLCLGADGKLVAKGKLGAAVGDLDRVVRVVRLGGFISSAPSFLDGPKIMNGASDLMVTVFGDKGRHARTTIGVAVLPLDAAVEVEGLFEVA
jgi:enamine deaminase RidA (YjgF/YER057c/UK114 family)